METLEIIILIGLVVMFAVSVAIAVCGVQLWKSVRKIVNSSVRYDIKEAPNPIAAAFSCPNDWRTVWGIARAVGMREQDVRSYLDCHPELFEASPIMVAGQTLYRAK